MQLAETWAWLLLEQVMRVILVPTTNKAFEPLGSVEVRRLYFQNTVDAPCIPIGFNSNNCRYDVQPNFRQQSSPFPGEATILPLRSC